MILYIAILVVLCLFTLVSARYQPARQPLYWASLVGLFLFSAYRLGVGCDWTGYLNIYRQAETTPWELLIVLTDPAFMLMNKYIQDLGLSYTYVNVISSLVFFVGIHFLAREQPNRLSFLMFLYPVLILNLAMSGIRQGMAVGILCGAYVLFQRNRKFWFLALVIIASGFHSSALIFAVLAPLAGRDISRQTLALFFVLMVAVVAFMAAQPGGQQTLERYTDTHIQSAGAAFRIMYLAIPCLFFIVFMRQKWKANWYQDYSLIVLCTIMLLLTSSAFVVSSTVADRFAYYFSPAQAIILARLPYIYSNRRDGVIIYGSYALMFVFFVFWASFSDLFELCYIPYDFGVFDPPDISRD